MKLCPKCNTTTRLATIYCPECGAKMKFIEKDITTSAAHQRQDERAMALQKQLIQWLALSVAVLVGAYCFRDYALDYSIVDASPMFYGPASITVDELKEPVVIGRGKGYLNLGRSGLPVPEVGTLEPVEAADEEKKDDEEALRVIEKARSAAISLTSGLEVTGKILGRTSGAVTISVGNDVRILFSEEIISQK